MARFGSRRIKYRRRCEPYAVLILKSFLFVWGVTVIVTLSCPIWSSIGWSDIWCHCKIGIKGPVRGLLMRAATISERIVNVHSTPSPPPPNGFPLHSNVNIALLWVTFDVGVHKILFHFPCHHMLLFFGDNPSAKHVLQYSFSSPIIPFADFHFQLGAVHRA